MVDVILGLQWGDEGKGKIVDYFAPRYDLIARFQGGPNAGHTLYVKDKKIVLHQIPSGIFHEKTVNLIGNGVVLDPVTLKRECESVAAFGVDYRKNLYIAQRAHLILPTHRALDKASEVSKGQEKIGSTLKGIGPYTAGAVLTFAYGQAEPIVDTNVRRVLRRVFCGRRTASDRHLWALSAALLPADDAYDFNQALMDFGATVCTARAPRCPSCPMRRFCAAYTSARSDTRDWART